MLEDVGAAQLTRGNIPIPDGDSGERVEGIEVDAKIRKSTVIGALDLATYREGRTFLFDRQFEFIRWVASGEKEQ